MLLLWECLAFRCGTKAYICSSVKVVPSFSVHWRTSNSQPRLSMLFVCNEYTWLYFLQTSSASRTTPLRMMGIFAASGTFPSKMLHPSHPARLAVAGSGFRFSMMSGTKKHLGTMMRLLTSYLS